MKLYRKYVFWLIWLLSLTSFSALSQKTIIKGSVVDAETGDPISFANVYIKGSTVGATSKVSGEYYIETTQAGDSLIASYIGYQSKTVAIQPGTTQTIDFVLYSDIYNLDGVEFVAPENPAWRIMRNVVDNKKRHDKRSLDTYEYDSYSKVEFAVAEMSDKFEGKKLVQRVVSQLDSSDYYRDDNGNPYIPIFHSETISRLYARYEPDLKKEEIKKANIKGVAIDNKKQVSQLTGVSFQEYNFYRNWINIVTRDFVSPIADGWRLYYEYYLVDSAVVDGHYSYKLKFYPKNDQDLAFQGHMWITKDDWALKEIDATVLKSANLNYIDKIYIHQKLAPVPNADVWLPTDVEFEILINDIVKNFTGVMMKFAINNSNFAINSEHPLSFYILAIEVPENAIEEDPEFWKRSRPAPLDTGDIKAIEAIDKIDNMRSITIIANTIKAVRSGFIRHGWWDWGPWIYTYAWNNVEGNRLRVGGRTNFRFSEKVALGGSLTYGTRDGQFKYTGNIDFILSRKPYTIISLSRRRDIEQLGTLTEADRDNFIFSQSTRFGTLRNPHFLTVSSFLFQTDIVRGITQQVELSNTHFEPLFPFAYIDRDDENNVSIKESYRTSEIKVSTRIGRDEIYLYDNVHRYNLGSVRKPVITLSYAMGLNKVLGSDFEYHKFMARVEQRANFSFLGTSFYRVEGGWTPSTIPYPSLKNHIGNTTIFYNSDAFNTMAFGEFVSDSYVFVKWSHFFEGFLLNRIPAMRKLKWRAVGYFNSVYGSLSLENQAIIPPTDLNGDPIDPPRSLKQKPYIEIGYGIENILKIIRVSAFHRLTYRDDPIGSKFTVNVLVSVRP